MRTDLPPTAALRRSARPGHRLASHLGRAMVAFAGLLIVGNLAILAAFAIARLAAPTPDLAGLDGIYHAREVAPGLWRGDGPSPVGYASLAERGVTTIVDLRTEPDEVPHALLAELGLRRVSIPIRDGQTPTPAQVQRLFGVVDDSDGISYVHCSAGVGRTGTMAAAYAVHQADVRNAWQALARNLAVGPPSLEQIVFVAQLDDGDIDPPPTFVSQVSRLFDAPRRIYSRIREGHGLTI